MMAPKARKTKTLMWKEKMEVILFKDKYPSIGSHDIAEKLDVGRKQIQK